MGVITAVAAAAAAVGAACVCVFAVREGEIIIFSRQRFIRRAINNRRDACYTLLNF